MVGYILHQSLEYIKLYMKLGTYPRGRGGGRNTRQHLKSASYISSTDRGTVQTLTHGWLTTAPWGDISMPTLRIRKLKHRKFSIFLVPPLRHLPSQDMGPGLRTPDAALPLRTERMCKYSSHQGDQREVLKNLVDETLCLRLTLWVFPSS